MTVPLRVPMTMKRSPSWSGKACTRSSAATFSPSSMLHEVRDRLALAAAADFRHVVHAQPVALAAVREDQQIRVRVGDEQVLDHVLFARGHADQALAAAPLAAVGVERRPLDVARARRRDHDVFVGDQILDPEVAFLALDDRRSAGRRRACRESPSIRRARCRSAGPRSTESRATARSARATRPVRRGSSGAPGRSAAGVACRGSPAPAASSGRSWRSGRCALRPGSWSRGSA